MAAEQMDITELRKEMSEKPATGNASPSKYTSLGAAITADLMIGFWLWHWSHFSHWGSK